MRAPPDSRPTSKLLARVAAAVRAPRLHACPGHLCAQLCCAPPASAQRAGSTPTDCRTYPKPPACPCCSDTLLQQCGIALPWQTSTGTMAAAGTAGGTGAAGAPVAVPQPAGQAAAATKPATQTKPGEAGGAATRACSGDAACNCLACGCLPGLPQLLCGRCALFTVAHSLPAAALPQAAPRRMPRTATSTPTTATLLRSAWNATTSACAAARAPPPPSAEHSAHHLSPQQPAVVRSAAICIALACLHNISLHQCIASKYKI